jgi:hypothetical protein
MPNPSEVETQHDASSVKVATEVCAKVGHEIVLFHGKSYYCQSCGLALDEIRKGEIDR